MNLLAQLKIVTQSNIKLSVNLMWFWRTAFVVYALLLNIGTYWPRLELGTTESPWPDKLLHMLAFGGLAFLFIQTRWIKKLYLCAIIAAAWTLFAEFSQSLPILGRESSWADALSGVMGVCIVIAWMWALGSIGGFANRLRLKQQRFLLLQLLMQTKNIIVLIASALVGAAIISMPVGLAWVFQIKTLLTDTELVIGSIVAGVVGAIAGINVVIIGLISRCAEADSLKASCFDCSTSCKDVSFDDEGKGKCPKCEAAVFRGQWAEPMQLPISALLKGAGAAVGVAISLLAAIAIALYGLTILHTKVQWARQINQAWNSWQDDLILTIDLTAIALIVAISIRIYRSRQSKFYDRQDKFCRSCDHDLQGTPIDRGVGRCPECGVTFAKFVNTEE